jgi:uncharacterized NAD(P)/FAD-binding protein YdhS
VIGSLLVDGWLRLDELALGIETTPDGNARDVHELEVADLFVVGTLRKPALRETTAVPELRSQAASVAARAFEIAVPSNRTSGLSESRAVSGRVA